jgi:sugar phosphate isomerase/epimerase
MDRRVFLASTGAALAAAASRLPANRNVKWAVSANLWNHFPKVPFTDILDVMRDTGFIGIRMTQFPGILKTYDITAAYAEREMSKRGLHVATISFNGPTHDPAQRAKVLADARQAMEFLKIFGAKHLVVFSPGRPQPTPPGGKAVPIADAAFRAMCEGFNQIGETAGEMGFQAGLHNHLDQMVETGEEVDRCMALTDPKLFAFSPDTAHLHLAGANVVDVFRKHQRRLMFADYKDARWTTPADDYVQANGRRHAKDSRSARFFSSIYDLGDGEIDFPALHRILRQVNFASWICVDLDTAREGPRRSYERCGSYVVSKLEPIYT